MRVLLLLTAFSIACGPATPSFTADGGPSTGGDGGGGSDPTFQFSPPTVTAVGGPNAAWALGDDITISGSNFLDPAHGINGVHLTGRFTDALGTATPFDADIPAEAQFTNAGTIHFSFGPTVFFSPTQFDLGTFTGQLTVKTTLRVPAANSDAGKSLTSAPANVTAQVAPSIAVTQLGSSDQDCGGVGTGTLDGNNVQLALHVVGGSSSTDTLTATLTFDSPALIAKFSTDPSATAPTGPTSFSVPVNTDGTVTINPKAGSMKVNNGSQTLYQLIASKTDLSTASTPTNLSIAVSSTSGQLSLSRSVDFSVFLPAEVGDDVTRPLVVAIYPAAVMVGPQQAGIQGSMLAYMNSSSDQDTNNISSEAQNTTGGQTSQNSGSSFGTNWGISGMATLGFGIVGLGSNVTGGATYGGQSMTQNGSEFGVNWGKVFSSTYGTTKAMEHTTATANTDNINAGQWGTGWIQKIQSAKFVSAKIHDACGRTFPTATDAPIYVRFSQFDWHFTFINTGSMTLTPDPAQMPAPCSDSKSCPQSFAVFSNGG